MKIIQFAFLLFLLISTTLQASSQQLKDDEIVLIKGEKFILHQVRTGETIFSISKNYQVDNAELVQNNPKLSEGLKIGDILQIPYRENVQKKQQPVFQKGDPTGFDYHPISSRKETPYFIAKKYGITVEELYAYNPGYNTLKKGDQLRIPRWDSKPAAVTEVTVPERKTEEPPAYQGFLEHTVLPGETVYSISKKYHVPESEILFYNPEAKTLKAGTQIYLPAVITEQPALSVDENQPGANFFEHIIESGETLWGISRKYGVSEEALKLLNPSLEAGFPAGAVMKIPAGKMHLEQANPVNEDAFIRHSVQKSETLYGIAAKYNLTIPDIKKYNPSLENRNLVNGETILIPKMPVAEVAVKSEEAELNPVKKADDYYKIEHSKIIPESCKPLQPGWLANETFTVALFLPLYIEANDNINKQIILTEPDSTSPIQGNSEILVEEMKSENRFKGFHENSENYLQFYEGVLLAVDSLKKTGMHIRLNVYDTEDSPQKVRKIMHDETFLQTDLIIGPVSPKEQKEVAPIASKNRIPMVSPLVSQSDDVRSNPYYFQVNPNRDYLTQKTAEMVVDEYFNSNIVILRTGNYEGTPEGRLVNLIREKLINSGALTHSNGGRFTVYDFKSERSSGLPRVLSKEKENVIIIPSSDEGELSVAIQNIDNFTAEYSITLVAPTRYQQQYRSIDIEKFHNLKMQHISPYWTEYADLETIRLIEKFRKNFYTEPNSFGMQGYDVAFYFLSALKNYGRNFEDCLPYLNVQLMQGNYYFDKVSAFGGYMNKGVSVISYEKDYDVVRKRVENRPRVSTH